MLGLVGGQGVRHDDLQLKEYASLSGRIHQLCQDFKKESKPALSRESISETDNRISRTILTMWIIDIILFLSVRSSSRFEEIRKELPGISGKVLSRKLTLLEGKGLITRHVTGSKPARVDYQLSSRGVVLAELLEPTMMYLRLIEDSVKPCAK